MSAYKGDATTSSSLARPCTSVIRQRIEKAFAKGRAYRRDRPQSPSPFDPPHHAPPSPPLHAAPARPILVLQLTLPFSRSRTPCPAHRPPPS